MHTIKQLVQGDEIQLWLRISYPLELLPTANSVSTYVAPGKAKTRTGIPHYTQFWGKVHANDVSNSILHLHVQPFVNQLQTPTGQGASTALHYSAFKRIRLVSPYHTPPDWENHKGTKPYRTSVEVLI